MNRERATEPGVRLLLKDSKAYIGTMLDFRSELEQPETWCVEGYVFQCYFVSKQVVDCTCAPSMQVPGGWPTTLYDGCAGVHNYGMQPQK